MARNRRKSFARRYKFRGRTNGYGQRGNERERKKKTYIKPGPMGIIEFIKNKERLEGRNRRVAAGYFSSLVSIAKEKTIYWDPDYPLAVFYLGTFKFIHIEPSEMGGKPMKLPPQSFFRRYDDYQQFEASLRSEAMHDPKASMEPYSRRLDAFLRASKDILAKQE